MERYEHNSRRTQRVRDVQTVLGYLTNRFNSPAFPAMSDHYQEPLDGQEYHPSPTLVEDTREGFDINGDWHTHGHQA